MSRSSSHIAKSAAVISIATLLSRVLGLVREQLIAVLFSRTATDAFYVAFRIPNLLRDLFAEGAMSSAFVPTFTEYYARRGPREAWRLASNVLNLLTLLLIFITLAGIYTSDKLVGRFAGGFRDVSGKFELTVLLTQVMFPFLPLVAIAAIVMGVLNSRGSFFLPALAPALFNVGSIATAVGFFFYLEHQGVDPILGMALGTLVGGSLQLLIQLPALFKKGFHYSFSFNLRHPGVQRILLLMGPGTLGLASTQINIFVNTWLATSQGEGPVSWLNYAFRLMQFPLGLFGVAIATAALPTVSEHLANRELEAVRSTVSSALRMVFVVNIPASLGLIALSHPIIAVIYQHGKFKQSDTNATANALVLYAIGLSAYSAVKVLVPVYYALGRSRVPVIISTVVVILNVVLNIILVNRFGYLGLAFGTSVTAIINFLLLFHKLPDYAGPLDTRSIYTTFAKMLVISTGMAASVYLMQRLTTTLWVHQNLLTRILLLVWSISVGVVVLFLGCRWMNISEVDSVVRSLKTRLLGKLN